MSTFSNTALSNLMLFVSIGSSSVVSLNYEINQPMIPENTPILENHYNIENWNNSIFATNSDYIVQDNNVTKISTILDFSKRILRNSKDLDGEFVDIVNENFWDLI
jgi:hypothetical protein